MRLRIGWLIASIVLLPVLAAAQDGLRSASLPDRPLSPSLPQDREDVFRATPETYRPRPDQLFFPSLAWPGVPQVGWPIVTQVVYVPVDTDALRATGRRYDHDRGEDAVRGRRREPVVEKYEPSAPGRPKTFYVIPGCYGGDRRPEPGSLAPGCSLAKLRIINP